MFLIQISYKSRTPAPEGADALLDGAGGISLEDDTIGLACDLALFFCTWVHDKTAVVTDDTVTCGNYSWVFTAITIFTKQWLRLLLRTNTHCSHLISYTKTI